MMREALVGCVVLAAALLACKEGSDGQGNGSTSRAPVVTAVPAEAKVAKLGETIGFDDSDWVVTEAKVVGQELKSGNQFIESEKTDGKFILVKFKVTNKTKEEQRILSRPKVKDAQGREFGAFDKAYFFLQREKLDSVALKALPASMPKQYGAIYEVPADASGLQFQAIAITGLATRDTWVDLGI